MEERSIDWVSRLNNIGPWVLSLIALLQVWVIEAWKRYRSGEIEIYANQIEVGYGTRGPVFSIFGTLRCTRDDVFVQEVRAELVRERDNAEHSFTWLALRPTTVYTTGEKQKKLEIASAFQIKEGETKRFGFLFHEEEFMEEHRPTLEELQSDWSQFYRQRSEQIVARANEEGRQVADPSTLSQNIYQEYVDQGGINDEFTELDRACYWEEGRYNLTLKIDTSSPGETFTKQFSFILSDKDAEGLRENAIAAVREVCNQPHNYQFAYPNLVAGE